MVQLLFDFALKQEIVDQGIGCIPKSIKDSYV